MRRKTSIYILWQPVEERVELVEPRGEPVGRSRRLAGEPVEIQLDHMHPAVERIPQGSASCSGVHHGGVHPAVGCIQREVFSCVSLEGVFQVRPAPQNPDYPPMRVPHTWDRVPMGTERKSGLRKSRPLELWSGG